MDPDGEIVDVLWTIDGGTIRSGKIIEHSFSTSGLHRISVIAKDDLGAISCTDLLIFARNIDPIAEAGGDNETLVGWPIILDGSLSKDTPSDRRNLTFVWDISDMGRYQGEIVELTVEIPGMLDIVLTVTDDDGISAIDRLRIWIKNITITSLEIEMGLDNERCHCGEERALRGSICFRIAEPGGHLDPSLTTIWIIVSDRTYIVSPSEDGSFRLDFEAPEKSGRYVITARIDRFGIIGEDSTVLFVDEERSNMIIFIASPIVIGAAASILVIAMGTGAVLSTDIGRWKFLLLMVPLFSRLSRDRLLENFERGRIYQYILMNPGDHFSHIREMLDLNIGTLTYHLTVLEREEYIKSGTYGIYKRFYPHGMKVEGNQMDIQELILNNLYDNPGMSQKEIAQSLGIHVSTVNYHVNMMVGAGLLTHYKKGQVQRYVVHSLPTVIPEAI
jgi:predicted transcriptional regulator